MIQYGEDKYIKDLITLWEICFPEDSDDFIRFYFEKVYKNEETLIFIEKKRVVSSLQMIPYPIKIKKTINLSGYISGAMTHPDFQNKGYMNLLLNTSFERMKEKGYIYSFLIPQEEWLFEYYQKYGYQKAFPMRKESIAEAGCRITYSEVLRDKTIRNYKSIQDIDINDFYIIYSRFLAEKENVVLKTKPQVTNILWDLFESQGILSYNDWGSAFIYPLEENVLIKDFFYYGDEIKQEFLHDITKNYPEKEIIIQNNPHAPFLTFKGMIKSLEGNANPTSDIYMSMMLD